MNTMADIFCYQWLHQCDLCKKRNVKTEASVWCFECSETLCSECIEIHQVQNETKDHKPIQIADYLKLNPTMTALKYECGQHGQKLDFYCVAHDTPICMKCVTDTHQTCTQIKSVSDITDNIKASFLFTDIKERASDVQAALQQIIEDVSNRQVNVGKEADRTISIIEATRKEINQHLDLLQDEIIKKIRSKENEQKGRINAILKTFHVLFNAAEEATNCIALADKHASNLHAYYGIKLWNDQIQRIERRISSLQKNLNFDQINVIVNLKLKNMKEDIKEFASLKIEHTQPAVKPLAKERQGQTSVSKPDISLSNARSFNLPADNWSFDVRGCCIMESGTMIFTDLHNQRLIAVDKTLKMSTCKRIHLSFNPIDVVEVADYTVGVTSLWEKKLVLVDINQGTVFKTVYEGEGCGRLCYTDGKFIVSVPPKKIMVIGDDGNVLSAIDTMENVEYCCAENEFLYYTAPCSYSVYCCDMAGNVKWKFTCDEGDFPSGITVGNKGNVIVSCVKDQTVKTINKSGKKSKVLLTDMDGIYNLKAIAHSRKRNILLAANSDGKCLVFDTNP